MQYLVHCGFEIFRNMTSNGFKLPFYVKNDFLKSKNPVLKFLQCIITIIDYCTKSYQVSLPHFRSLPFDSKVRHLHLETLIHDIF